MCCRSAYADIKCTKLFLLMEDLKKTRRGVGIKSAIPYYYNSDVTMSDLRTGSLQVLGLFVRFTVFKTTLVLFLNVQVVSHLRLRNRRFAALMPLDKATKILVLV